MVDALREQRGLSNVVQGLPVAILHTKPQAWWQVSLCWILTKGAQRRFQR